MIEQKATLPSLRNQVWKKVKEETDKINRLLKYIPTDNITELNELIYAGGKQVCDKIGIPQKNENRNLKKTCVGNKVRRENEETSETSKEGKTYRDPTELKYPRKTRAVKSDMTTGKMN